MRALYSESGLPEWEVGEVHSRDWEAAGSDAKGREEEEGRMHCGLEGESGDASGGEGHGHDGHEWEISF